MDYYYYVLASQSDADVGFFLAVLGKHQGRAQFFVCVHKFRHATRFLNVGLVPPQCLARLFHVSGNDKFLSRLGVDKTQHGTDRCALVRTYVCVCMNECMYGYP